MRKFMVLVLSAFMLFAFTSCDPAETPDEFEANITSTEELADAIADLSAASGAVEWKLADGTYDMQIVIPAGADVAIIGESKDGVILTFGADEYSVSAMKFIENVIGEEDAYGVIIANAGSKLAVSNVTIKADPEKITNPSGLAHKRLAGIVTKDADLAVDNVLFTDIHCSESDNAGLRGMNHGYGILTCDDAASPAENTITITDSEFTDFQKAAIYVDTLNSAPSSDNVTITGNTITGEGQNDIIAQNGIWTYTTGNLTIEDNIITDLLYKKDGNDYGSTGIAVDGRFTAGETAEADAYVQLLTENNTIENVDDPVYVAGETTEATT